jgi:serine phosphatase RsbU (regulator of sigma subunit)
MRDAQITSDAYQNAELKSERLRIFGVFGFLGFLLAVLITRVFVLRTAVPADPHVRQCLFLIVIIAGYEYWVLRRVENALKEQLPLARPLWVLSTALEASVPAWAIAILPHPDIDAVYRPLATPLVLIFPIFIILSTLRLRPWITVFSGTVAAATYLAAALYLGWRPQAIGSPAVLIAHTAVTLNAVTLLATGIVAGAIARQIRKHVLAALRQAETRRKLDAVRHDLNVARSIQQSLLPRQSPKIPGFDIAGWNQPADDTGGDYFDWESFDDGKVIVSLADVTGHGIGPALLAAVCRAYARASFRVNEKLTASFEHINRALGADLGSGRFATFVAAACSPECESVEVLSAGHGPLLVYSSSTDRFIEMNAHGVPLGILPSFKSDAPTDLQLHPGDLLLLATDGFIEWENEVGEAFGICRIEEVIRASRQSLPKDIIANLYQAVVKFSNGTKQQDDLTAVVIKRT